MRRMLLLAAVFAAVAIGSAGAAQAHDPAVGRYRYGGFGYYYSAPFRPGRFYYAPQRGYDYHYFRMTPGYYGYGYFYFRGPGAYHCYPRY